MTKMAKYILTCRPSRQLDKGALTFMERAQPDIALAERQHARYREAVAGDDTVLIDIPASDEFPDSTFVEDVLLAFPECLIMCRPGTASRLAEPQRIAPYLPNDRPVFHIEAPATIDGGDVLQIGRDVFVGLSTRTNEAAITMVARLLSPYGYTVKAVRVTGALHLKTSVTAPRNDILVANAEWVDLTAFGSRRIITVDPLEPFAGNTLCVDDRLFMQASHHLTAERLRAEGLGIDCLDISEFAKIEAGLTCMSVLLPPPTS
jgi:dimethylargininase